MRIEEKQMVVGAVGWVKPGELWIGVEWANKSSSNLPHQPTPLRSKSTANEIGVIILMVENW